VFVCPQLRAAQTLVTGTSDSNAWVYDFHVNEHTTEWAREALGSFHGADVPYLFDRSHYPYMDMLLKNSPGGRAVAAWFQQAVASLSTTGSGSLPISLPLNVKSVGPGSVLNWQPFSYEGNSGSLQVNVSLATGLATFISESRVEIRQRHACDFWDSVHANEVDV